LLECIYPWVPYGGERSFMIGEVLYQNYLNALLAGRRKECRDMVRQLLGDTIEIKDLYTDLFQRSLYDVGELWETNRITVASEHLATSITESLLNLAYPVIFGTRRTGKKAVIACSANEFHQVGGKMVADIFELHGWDGHFLGANTPPHEMARFIHDLSPDVVGFSLALLSNIDLLKQGIEVVRADFPYLDLLVGGQAFRWGGLETLRHYSGTEYIGSLDGLEKWINGR
jgi:MerR family transcriptional regulator, light-induced transcriptional regulator